jgi:urocanate hydratase
MQGIKTGCITLEVSNSKLEVHLTQKWCSKKICQLQNRLTVATATANKIAGIFTKQKVKSIAHGWLPKNNLAKGSLLL